MWLCPVCNGFTTFQRECPTCASTMEDMGKLSDYYAPYSPYRPIDDLKLTDGYEDLTQHECVHDYYCPSCGSNEAIAIAEQNIVQGY